VGHQDRGGHRPSSGVEDRGAPRCAIAALSIVGGLVILTIPFWRFGDSWWIVLITAPLGAATLVVGILGSFSLVCDKPAGA